MSCARGIFKQFVTKFKDYFRSASDIEASGGLSDPFFCMNISCPIDSYDINIEPAKDDALFAMSDEILDLVEQILKNFYGALPESHAQKRNSHARPSKTDGIQLLMNGKGLIGQPVKQPTPLSNERRQLFNGRDESRQCSLFIPEDTNTRATWTRHQPTEPCEPQSSAEDESELRSKNISNPWIMAKMNAPVRQQMLSPHREQLPTPGQENGGRNCAGSGSEPVSNHSALASLSSSPERSPMRSEYMTEDSSSPTPFPYPLSARRRRQVHEASDLDKAQRPLLSTARNSWVQRSSASNAMANEQSHDYRPDLSSQFIPASALPPGTHLADIPFASPNRQRKVSLPKGDCPKDSPIGHERTWFGQVRRAPRVRLQDDAAIVVGTAPIRAASEEFEHSECADANNIHPDLALTLDYERRKADAIQKHKLHLKQQKKAAALSELAQTGLESSMLPAPYSALLRRSPHQNRYEKAIAALRTNEDAATADSSSTEDLYESVFQAHDTRLTLIRGLDQSESRTPSVAMQALKLPLETIPRGECTRLFVQTIKVDERIKPMFRTLLAKSDPWTSKTAEETACSAFIGLACSTAQCADWWASVLVKLLKTSTLEMADIEKALRNDIKKALVRIPSP